MNADEDIKNYLRQSASSADRSPADIRKGFVYKRVPHVTLKSIANNPDIREGMTRDQIDAAIRRHAETETLYDQPYEDKSRIRVSGPFTVESLSPDRIVSTDEERPESELIGQKQPGRADFATMILDNLRKAGVQNTFKNERLKFDGCNRAHATDMRPDQAFFLELL
jgi:adenine-specific DNA-methyltransferase